MASHRQTSSQVLAAVSGRNRSHRGVLLLAKRLQTVYALLIALPMMWTSGLKIWEEKLLGWPALQKELASSDGQPMNRIWLYTWKRIKQCQERVTEKLAVQHVISLRFRDSRKLSSWHLVYRGICLYSSIWRSAQFCTDLFFISLHHTALNTECLTVTWLGGVGVSQA